MFAMTSNGAEDLCKRLQTLQVQLRLVLERNQDVMGHLEQVDVSTLTDNGSIVNHDVFVDSLEICQSLSRQVQGLAEKQCQDLEEQIRELVRQPDDDQFGGLNRVSDFSAVAIRQQLFTQAHFDGGLPLGRVTNNNCASDRSECDKPKLPSGMRAANSVRSVLNRMDETATYAEDTLKHLKQETERTQKTSEEYKKLYEDQKLKMDQYNRREDESYRRPRSQSWATSYPVETSSETDDSANQPYFLQAPTARMRAKSFGHVKPQAKDRQYLCLINENKNLQTELKRLQDENSYLTGRRIQDSKSSVSSVQHYLATCQSQRNALQIGLKHEHEASTKPESMFRAPRRQKSNFVRLASPNKPP